MIALSNVRKPQRMSFALQNVCHQRFIIFSLFLTVFLFTWSIYTPDRSLFTSLRTAEHVPSDLRAIYNHTLGFQEIFGLALPTRQDRIDALLHAGNASNISISILNAVHDSEIPKDHWPSKWNPDSHVTGELGCVMSHVNTWKKMIADNITSALVMESDADFDLRIHQIMAPFSPALTAFTAFANWHAFDNSREHVPPSPSAPYGLSWDIIWMGHCGCNAEGASRIYSWNDTSVPPENREFVFDIGLQSDQHIPGTRALFEFERTTCSTGYAITNAGAKKLVEYFKDADSNLDIQLSSICSKHPNLICLGVWPQVITSGGSSSNIDHTGAGDVVPGTAGNGDDTPQAGPAIQYSARVNAERVRKGEPRDKWKKEWDTMWAAGEYEEEKGMPGDGRWVEMPLNLSVAFQEPWIKQYGRVMREG